ncbi:MAG: hypothetical protein ROO76_13090 [Terriglobia bacterium]|nr:hypothetical protein [Terriglobia bacterium]
MKKRLTIRLLAIAILALFAAFAIAQERSETQITQEQSTHEYQVEKGEVVYVSGNEIVVRMENGEVRNMTVPPDATATVDGKTITVKDLKPGMKLERTIKSTTTPELVTTVRTIEGTVWHVNAPKTVILTLANGENKKYNVPKDQIFQIDGQDKTVFDLRKGMKVTATVITRVPQSVIAQEKSVTGKMPPPPPTPPIQGALLIEEKTVPVEVATTAAPQTQEKLPKTASIIPLIGLLGLGCTLLGLGINHLRSR